MSFLVEKDCGGSARKVPHRLNHQEGMKMPLFMDVHKHVPGATGKDVADAHMKDLEMQGKYGVKYLKYFFDEKAGSIFCLVEAPTKEAAEKVHREAHGLLADEIHEVIEGS